MSNAKVKLGPFLFLFVACQLLLATSYLVSVGLMDNQIVCTMFQPDQHVGFVCRTLFAVVVWAHLVKRVCNFLSNFRWPHGSHSVCTMIPLDQNVACRCMNFRFVGGAHLVRSACATACCIGASRAERMCVHGSYALNAAPTE